MSMSAKERKKQAARKLYAAGFGAGDIAATLEITERTVGNYKAEDAATGNDWDSLRAAQLMGDNQEERSRLLDNFVGMMHKSVREIHEDPKMTAQQKASAIVSIGDAYSKMLKVARQEDPEAYKLSIVKRTVFLMLEYIRPVVEHDALERIVGVLGDASFRDRLADV